MIQTIQNILIEDQLHQNPLQKMKVVFSKTWKSLFLFQMTICLRDSKPIMLILLVHRIRLPSKDYRGIQYKNHLITIFTVCLLINLETLHFFAMLIFNLLY